VLHLIRDGFFPDVSTAEWRRRIDASMEAVRLDPGQVLNKYPHQLSGGQLQRMLIARALLLDIKLLVADEIISMLDASTRIDVLNLLAELKPKGLGVLFITHDLSLGNYISDKVVILRRGVVVEMGATAKVFGNPLHPYTQTLLGSVPKLHQKWDRTSPVAAGAPVDESQCVYHQLNPSDTVASPDDAPTLAKVDDDHLVGCAQLGNEHQPAVAAAR
jgi:peptide/nickel transport system ATP-binding protein